MNEDASQAMSASELPDDVNQRIEQLTRQYLSDLQRGQSVEIQQLTAEHPDLAPHLETRLRLCRAVFQASQQVAEPAPATSTPDATSPNTSSLDVSVQAATKTFDEVGVSQTTGLHPFAFRIRCPHCGRQVQVIDDRAPEVTCQSCGSSVKISSRPSSTRISAPPLPKSIGHFQILRVLGEGGFGIVYLGRDSKLDRLVAVKVPRNVFFGSAEEERRFFREARHVAQLKHAHIAQVYEISDHRTAPFIASEYIDGMTLRDHARNNTLTYEEIAEVLVQVAEAVEFAHRHKIVHRDLKTSNILIGPNLHAYVVDFGLSRREDAELTITIDGALVGTLHYMSPEQAAGKADIVGPLSDVYSLGVILYELLCNQLPFHGSKRMLIDQVIHDEPRAPRRLNEKIPKDLETIALKAMAKKAVGRYASAQAFAEDLKYWLQGEPIRARPVSPLVHFWSWCQRNPVVSSLAATIAGLLLLVTGLSIGWAVEQSRMIRNEKQLRTLSESRQYELLTQNGMYALDRNDLAQSAYWLSEALSIRDTPASRLRLGMIQDRLPKLTELWPTGAKVDIIEFSRNGGRVAVASFDGHTQVFDLASRKGIFDQKLPRVSYMELSPDGQQLLTYGGENHARLWDISANRLIRLLAHTDYVVSAHFHSDGLTIATGAFDGFARVWKAADGELQRERQFDSAQVTCVEFVPDTNQAIVVTRPSEQFTNRLAVWDVATDQILLENLELDSDVIALKTWDEGTRVSCATRSGQITRWRLPSGEALGGPIQLSTTPAYLFFEDDERALAVSDDMQAQTWDLRSGQPRGVGIRGLANLATAAVDQQQNLLALAGADGSLQVYWQLTGLPAMGALHHGQNISRLKFHPDGRQLAVGSRDGVLSLWNLAAAAPTVKNLEHRGSVRNALYSPDGNGCMTIDASGQGHLWSTSTGQKVGATLKHEGPILDCLYSPNGQVCITAGADGTIKLCSALDGTPLGTPLVHAAAVTHLAINPQGNLLLSGCADGTITFWTIDQLDSIQSVTSGKHNGQVTRVAFNSNGSLAISSSLSGDLLCWDATSRQPKYGPYPPNASYNFCDFIDHDQSIFTCDVDNAVKLWDLPSAKVRQTLICNGSVNMALPYGLDQFLVTCETNGSARFWERKANGFQLVRQIQHPAIQSMRWAAINSQSSQIALAGGTLDLSKQQVRAGAVLLWDVIEHKPLAPTLRHRDLVRRVAFHPREPQLLTASLDNTACLWTLVSNTLPPEDAVRVARLMALMKPLDGGPTANLSPEEQSRELEQMRTLHPNYFTVTAEDLELWNNETRRHRTLKDKGVSESSNIGAP